MVANVDEVVESTHSFVIGQLGKKPRTTSKNVEVDDNARLPFFEVTIAKQKTLKWKKQEKKKKTNVRERARTIKHKSNTK